MKCTECGAVYHAELRCIPHKLGCKQFQADVKMFGMAMLEGNEEDARNAMDGDDEPN